MPHAIILDDIDRARNEMNRSKKDLEIIHEAIHAMPEGSSDRQRAENALAAVGANVNASLASFSAAINDAKAAAGLA